MIDVRSRLLKVSHDKRQDPRLEIRCKVFFDQINGAAEMTDFSMGGFFAEMSDIKGLELGMTTNVVIKFPMEENAFLQKVKIVSINDRGVGCQFIGLTKKNSATIENCFEIFKNTLPIS